MAKLIVIRAVMFRILAGVLMVFSQIVCAMDHVVQVGSTQVIVRTLGCQGRFYIHLHQNETTALQAAKELIDQEGGHLVTLVHPYGRNISFTLNNKRYTFDPNRMFTKDGIKKTLSQYSHYDTGAAKEVNKLASTVKALIPTHGKVTALHNNQQYSILSYLPGHEYQHDAQEVFLPTKKNHRNFYVLTQMDDYLRLQKEGFNCVLQARHAADDGSLSVYLASRHYVNIEAAYGAKAIQKQMIKHA